MKLLDKFLSQKALKYIIVVIVIGTVTLFAGIALGVAIGNMVRNGVTSMAVKDSPEHSSFDPPDPDTAGTNSVYFWNLTNPDAVMAGGTPNFQEVGPYDYTELSYRTNVAFSDDRTEFSYKSKIVYIAQEGNTAATDSITMLNPIYYGVIAQTGGESNFLVPVTAQALGSVIQGLQSPDFQMLTLANTAVLLLLGTKATLVAASNESTFLESWSNVTSVLPGYTTSSTHMQAGVENNASLAISSSIATLLWDNTQPASFVNTNLTVGGIGLWMAQLADSNDTSTLETLTGLTGPQVLMVTNWLATVWTVDASLTVLSLNPGLDSINDLGYAQWGTGIPTAMTSVDSVMVPEFAIWAQTLFPGVEIMANTSKLFFSGSYNLTDPVNLGTFLYLSQNTTANMVTLSAMYPGLDSSVQVMALAAYLGVHVMGDMVTTGIIQPLLNAGGGLFSTRTAECWMWGTCDDPLLSLLMQTPTQTRLLYNDTISSTTTTEASGVGDLNQVGRVLKMNDQTEIAGVYPETITVEGQSGFQYPPFQKSPPSEYLLWGGSSLKRSLRLVYQGEVENSGITLDRYVLDPATFDVSTKYGNTIPGFISLSAVAEGLPMYLSLPHFKDIEGWSNNFTSNMSPNDEIHQIIVDIQRFAGMALNGNKATQTNFYLQPGLTLFDTFYSGVTTGRMYPLYWACVHGGIDDETADVFKSKLIAGKQMSEALLLTLVIIGSLILFAGLFLLAVWYLKRNSKTQVKSINNPPA